MIDNDSNTEAMIQEAGKTAPRITPDSIKAVIASEHYFTAQKAACMSGDDIEAMMRLHGPANPLALLTCCVLVLKNGFTVMGKSACASPENFDANIGRKVARDDAISQVWPLEGYLLKQALYQRALFDASPKTGDGPADTDSGRPAHQQRVVDEAKDLAGKIGKLSAFLVTPTFQRLGDAEQTRLANQVDVMRLYCTILEQRIEAFPQ